MSSLFAWRVLLFVAELFVASSFIVVLAWLASLRGTASWRHLVWLGAFGVMAILPLLALIVPSHLVFMLAAPPVMQSLAVPLTPEVIAALQAAPPPQPSFHIDPAAIIYGLAALWLLGVMFLALRGALAVFGLRNMRRHSAPHVFGHIAIEGPRCELRISLSDDDRGPVTWGFVRPVILLPRDSVFWPQARLEAVLRHELAHVSRLDCLMQVLSLAIAALYWPNPLVWMAVARLRREAEMAADDAVLASGVKASVYANALVQIASEFAGSPARALPLFMAAPSSLEARVEFVLALTKSRSGVTSMDVFKIACLGMMAATATAFALPSLAQDAPQVQSAPLPAPAAQASPVAQAAPAAPADEAQPATRVTRSESIVIDSDDNGHQHVRQWNDLSPQEKARVDVKVRAAIAKAKPQIERAMREARVEMAAMRAVEIDRPRIEAAMAEAMRATKQINEAQIQAAIAAAHKALADMPDRAAIDAQVHDALRKAHLQLEAMRVRRGGDVTFDVDSDDEAPLPPLPPAPGADAAPPAPPTPPAAPPAPQN